MAPFLGSFFFITDYSDAEISAITKLFPNTHLYLCNIHREQAWERWVKDRKHRLNQIQSSELLELLRDCANSPVVMHRYTFFKTDITSRLFCASCINVADTDIFIKMFFKNKIVN